MIIEIIMDQFLPLHNKEQFLSLSKLEESILIILAEDWRDDWESVQPGVHIAYILKKTGCSDNDIKNLCDQKYMSVRGDWAYITVFGAAMIGFKHLFDRIEYGPKDIFEDFGYAKRSL